MTNKVFFRKLFSRALIQSHIGMTRGKYRVFRTYSERRNLVDPAIYGTAKEAAEELLDEGHGFSRAVKCAMGVALGGIRKSAGAKALIIVTLNGPTEVVP